MDYDPGSHQLVCNAHGAVFDPTNGFSAIQGPANSPLPSVSISINADGTITVKKERLCNAHERSTIPLKKICDLVVKKVGSA